MVHHTSDATLAGPLTQTKLLMAIDAFISPLLFTILSPWIKCAKKDKIQEDKIY